MSLSYAELLLGIKSYKICHNSSMKKHKYDKNINISLFLSTLIVVLFLLLSFFPTNSSHCYAKSEIENEPGYQTTQLAVESTSQTSTYPTLNFYYSGKRVEIDKVCLDGFSKARTKIINSGFKSQVMAMNFAKSIGLGDKEAVGYAFPNIAESISSLQNEVYIAPKDASLSAIKNTGKIQTVSPSKGLQIDENVIYSQIISKFNNLHSEYNFDLTTKSIDYDIDINDLSSKKYLRSSFTTYFSSSTESRKNNIRQALKAFDGIILKDGESLSFNNTTGYRTEENGYQKAKIIKQGAFVTEYGGGVCQVSSTLYNSALLADLEIVEVHPHSLPVSYVSPCFDAMVNSGSSDLVIKNNTGEQIIIATSSKNNECTINIYGVKNNYKIVRKSQKTEDLLQFETETTTDYKAYGLDAPLESGQSQIVCHGKAGYKAVGKLEYYDKNGVLVKTKQIRSNVYKPTKEVTLIGS